MPQLPPPPLQITNEQREIGVMLQEQIYELCINSNSSLYTDVSALCFALGRLLSTAQMPEEALEEIINVFIPSRVASAILGCTIAQSHEERKH